MLEIKNLHASVDGNEILRGINLTINAGEVHAIMGPNGSGKSTLSYVLAGKDDYEITEGEILFKGENLLEMKPDERAAAGVFLAFQYPIEIPGVATMTFLRTAMNAQRKARGEAELNTPDFMKIVKQKAAELKVSPDMLKRPLNVGFSGGEKKRNEIMLFWGRRCVYSMKPIPDWTLMPCGLYPKASMHCAARTAPCW